MTVAPGKSEMAQSHGALARTIFVCLACSAAVTLAGGGDAFWLCIPAALLLAATAATARVVAFEATLTALAAAVPELVSKSLGPPPSLPLAAFVLAASVTVAHSVRGRLEAEREALRASALSDPLTGIANRRALGELIDYEVARHARQRRAFAVLVLDLDGFKRVNDRFGHAAGDELLRDVAQALRLAVREQDTVGRLGGDEFCVLAPETESGGAQRLMTRVEEAVTRVTDGLESLSASVGFALFPADGTDAASVLEAADAAQSNAKRRVYAGRARRAA